MVMNDSNMEKFNDRFPHFKKIEYFSKKENKNEEKKKCKFDNYETLHQKWCSPSSGDSTCCTLVKSRYDCLEGLDKKSINKKFKKIKKEYLKNSEDSKIESKFMDIKHLKNLVNKCF